MKQRSRLYTMISGLVSEPSTFGKRKCFRAGDNEVVQRFDINKRKSLLQCAGKQLVGTARFCYSGRVIVGKDDCGGIRLQCSFHHFARINARLQLFPLSGE